MTTKEASLFMCRPPWLNFTSLEQNVINVCNMSIFLVRLLNQFQILLYFQLLSDKDLSTRDFNIS